MSKCEACPITDGECLGEKVPRVCHNLAHDTRNREFWMAAAKGDPLPDLEAPRAHMSAPEPPPQTTQIATESTSARSHERPGVKQHRERHLAYLKAKKCPHFIKDPKCGCVSKGKCGLGRLDEHQTCYVNPTCIDCVLAGGWEAFEKA